MVRNSPTGYDWFMATVPQPWFTPEEYVVLEDQSEMKHEYHAGRMYAMSGASMPHTEIQVNLYREVSFSLKGTPCKMFPSDLRIWIEADGSMTYPDLSIFCAKPTSVKGLTNSFVNPICIIEVLSPSTESYDRGKKFDIYRQIPTLQEYVLIAQSEPAVDLFRRQQNGHWDYVPIRGINAILELTSASIQIPLGEIYLGITFDE